MCREGESKVMVMKREDKRSKGLLPDPVDEGGGECLPDPVKTMVFTSSLCLAMTLLFHDALIE